MIDLVVGIREGEVLYVVRHWLLVRGGAVLPYPNEIDTLPSRIVHGLFPDALALCIRGGIVQAGIQFDVLEFRVELRGNKLLGDPVVER